MSNIIPEPDNRQIFMQQDSLSEDELLKCFDEQGDPIAPQPRGVVHEKPYHIWHAVTNIWVINSKREILCTHRAPHVSGNPGKWQTYVGGHVKTNSTFSKTALEELTEEIGVKIVENDIKLVERGRRDDVMHIYESYAVIFDRDLSDLGFSDGEVSEARWFSFEEYQKSKTENPDMWCNGMKPEHYQKISEVFSL